MIRVRAENLENTDCFSNGRCFLVRYVNHMILFFSDHMTFFFRSRVRDVPLFFSGEGGMRNIEKNCLQGLKRPTKLFVNTICIEKKFAEKSDKLVNSK